jgi:hypothetical protein
VIRYIVVVHYHYDSTEPVDGEGTDAKPVPSYATLEEAVARSQKECGPSTTGYVWAVKV